VSFRRDSLLDVGSQLNVVQEDGFATVTTKEIWRWGWEGRDGKGE
jgi:hypothetical protein